MIAGGLVGLVDSTVGWAIAVPIGADAGADDSTMGYISALMAVTLLAGVAAGLGASFDRRRRARARAAHR